MSDGLEQIEAMVETFREVRDRLPLDLPSPLRDSIAAMYAMGGQSFLERLVAQQQPRCFDHFKWPRCIECGVEIRPPESEPSYRERLGL